MSRFLKGVKKAMIPEIAQLTKKYTATLSDIPRDLQSAIRFTAYSPATSESYHYIKNISTSCKSLKGLTYGYSF